ncbi:hypothetical protein HPULCUR_001849 [Helicostylum pulchrum]|uniref:Uncharacterized protein n=1 Tax=Helicostylum pulchrum TaxID=562976 RepID=A0ABP9XQW2_9FUNG
MFIVPLPNSQHDGSRNSHANQFNPDICEETYPVTKISLLHANIVEPNAELGPRDISAVNDSKYIKLDLSFLPIYPRDELRVELPESLVISDEVLDVGIYKDTGGFRICSINTDEANNPKQYKSSKISHTISWRETDDFLKDTDTENLAEADINEKVEMSGQG